MKRSFNGSFRSRRPESELQDPAPITTRSEEATIDLTDENEAQESQGTSSSKADGRQSSQYPSTWPKYAQKFFVLQSVSDSRTVAKCTLCNRDISGASNCSSNFLTHLKRKHDAELKAFIKERTGGVQTLITPLVTSTAPRRIPLSSKRIQELDEVMLMYVALDQLPLSTMESEGFLFLMNSILPEYPVPSRERLKSSIFPTLYRRMEEQLCGFLDGIQSCAIVVDIWSSRSMDGYIGVSCSTVKDFKPVNLLLACRNLEGRHTAERILQEYDDIVMKWKLSGKVIKCVTDNASNMKKAFRLSVPGWESDDSSADAEDVNAGHLMDSENADVAEEDLLDEEDLENDDKKESEVDIRNVVDDGTLFRASCIAHTLQLVVKDAMKVIEHSANNAVARISKIVSSIRKSTVDTEVLVQSVNFRIPSATPTRWNSQLTMLEKFLHAIEKDPSLGSRLQAIKKYGSLTPTEVKKLRELVTLLGPLKDATNAVQKDGETLGAVVPVYLDLVAGLAKHAGQTREPSTLVYCRKVADALLTSLQRRLQFVMDPDNLFIIGACLDPRFKLQWVAASDDYTPRKAQDLVLAKLEAFLATQRSIEAQQIVQQAKDVGKDESHKRRRLFSNLQLTQTSKERESTSRRKAESELLQFFSEPAIDLDQAPLDYWKSNASRFPLISSYVTYIYCVPASSGTIERVFSRAQDILTAKRNRLNPSLFEQLLMLKYNAVKLKCFI